VHVTGLFSGRTGQNGRALTATRKSFVTRPDHFAPASVPAPGRTGWLKGAVGTDETGLVAAQPGAWPAGQAPGKPSADEVEQVDLTRSDWWGAEQRRVGSSSPARPGTSLSEGLAPATELSLAGAAAPSSLEVPLGPASPKRRGWVPLTRLWALLKVASMAYTTWWAMGYTHAGLGTRVSAYGAVCLFAGFGARWRKRFFGPGQLIEPELYEEIGRWLYRLGVALVLIGGAAVITQYASH
jgi:hypothetical protein